MLKALKKRISNNRGLTLVELIIVVAIIGVLSVVGISQFAGMTEAAKVQADKAVLAEIENAAKLYIATERDDVESLDQLISKKYIEENPELQSKNVKGADITVSSSEGVVNLTPSIETIDPDTTNNDDETLPDDETAEK